MGKTVTIASRDGISLLKATRVAAAVRRLRSVVFLKSGERISGARNVPGVLALCSALGTPVEIEAFGSEAHLAARAVEEILGDSSELKTSNTRDMAGV